MPCGSKTGCLGPRRRTVARYTPATFANLNTPAVMLALRRNYCPGVRLGSQLGAGVLQAVTYGLYRNGGISRPRRSGPYSHSRR